MVNVYKKISCIKIRKGVLNLNDETRGMITDINRYLDSIVGILTKLPDNHPYLNRLAEAYNKVVCRFNTKHQEFLIFQHELMSYMESLDSVDAFYILTRTTHHVCAMEKSWIHCLKMDNLVQRLHKVEETKESN